jgi:leucyl/phenylalanyl-tRNA--protein transferase
MALELQFPDPNQSDDEGLVAVGGNLSREFLLAAYSQGLFPWYNEGEPVLWWSPNPRMVLYPKKFKCSKSLRQVLNKQIFTVKLDTNFEQVIDACATIKRNEQKGTWITKEMKDAYINLHHEGFAHSVETYLEGKLVGGLYGISLGKAFFGESMFFTIDNASKVALFHLVELMKKWGYWFIDVQQSTQHLRSLGAEDIDREIFLNTLKDCLKLPTKKGNWKFYV